MEEGDQLLNPEKADGESLKSFTSFKTEDEAYKYHGGIAKEPKYSKGFQTAMYLTAITAGILQGYQIGIIAGIELFVPDEYSGIVI